MIKYLILLGFLMSCGGDYDPSWVPNGETSVPQPQPEKGFREIAFESDTADYLFHCNGEEFRQLSFRDREDGKEAVFERHLPDGEKRYLYFGDKTDENAEALFTAAKGLAKRSCDNDTIEEDAELEKVNIFTKGKTKEGRTTYDIAYCNGHRQATFLLKDSVTKKVFGIPVIHHNIILDFGVDGKEYDLGQFAGSKVDSKTDELMSQRETNCLSTKNTAVQIWLRLQGE